MVAFDVRWIDVKPYLLTGEQPVIIIPRPKAHNEPKAWAGTSEVACLGEYWMPQGPVFGEQMEWSVTRTGDVIRVPVYAYKVHRSLASIFALGVQIGMAALAELRHHTREAAREAVLVLGNECTDLTQEDSFRCYVGIAIRTK